MGITIEIDYLKNLRPNSIKSPTKIFGRYYEIALHKRCSLLTVYRSSLHSKLNRKMQNTVVNCCAHALYYQIKDLSSTKVTTYFISMIQSFICTS